MPNIYTLPIYVRSVSMNNWLFSLLFLVLKRKLYSTSK